MSDNSAKFQFCPYCYEDFPQDEENPVGDHCPFCGVSLLDFWDTADGAPQEEGESAPPEREAEGEPAAEGGILEAVVKKKKKTVIAEYIECQNYNVVLKACPDIASLANRLEQVFHRDIFAIRLALNNLPTVIVYKGNISDMETVIGAFRAENAAMSVLGGEFKIKANVHEQYPVLYKQPLEIQNMFYLSPAQLWLGDKIYTAVSATTQGRSGMLTITDQGLYFLDKYGDLGGCRWFIVPYYQVEEMSYFEDEIGTGIFARWKIQNKDNTFSSQTEKFYIPEADQSRTAIDLALISYDTGNYRQRILFRCQDCGYRRREILGEHVIPKACPRCGKDQIDLSFVMRSRI
ncbi:MAG: hypothetical protein LBR56_04990 [Sporomusaceae bacterium]|jgi:hypothetical protein|nr:hypothetical protein [Sporomusaceae bacterium]